MKPILLVLFLIMLPVLFTFGGDRYPAGRVFVISSAKSKGDRVELLRNLLFTTEIGKEFIEEASRNFQYYYFIEFIDTDSTFRFYKLEASVFGRLTESQDITSLKKYLIEYNNFESYATRGVQEVIHLKLAQTQIKDLYQLKFDHQRESRRPRYEGTGLL